VLWFGTAQRTRVLETMDQKWGFSPPKILRGSVREPASYPTGNDRDRLLAGLAKTTPLRIQ